MRVRMIGAIAFFATAAIALAQNPAHVDVKMSLVQGVTRGQATPSGIVDVPADGVVVAIDCGATNNCDNLDALLDNQPHTIDDVSKTSGKITIQQADVSSAGSPLVILDHTTRTPTVTVTLRAPQSGGTPGGGNPATASGCNMILANSYEPELDRRGKPKGAEGQAKAHFVVTPGGSILQYPDEPVDENDRVFVHVYGEPNEVANIEVARTSPTRVPGAHFVGEGTTVTLKSKTTCVERVFELGDFAAGEGAVEMYTVASGQKVSKGAFKFTVDTLYAGILGFGPIFTRGIGDETFKLQAKGDKKVITASEEGKRNVVYAVSYTYYMWGQRDLEKPETRPWAHVNPTLAISVNNMSDHAIVGASVDIGQFIITIGTHVAHVTRLSSSSGLSDGSEFTGTADDIPTSKRWQAHAFVGVSVDIRAAAALLKTIATGGGS